MAATIKSQNPFRHLVIGDEVRILAARGHDLGERLERLQIEHAQRVVTPVTGIALAKVAGQRHAMNARRIRYFRKHDTFIGVHHLHTGAARDEQAVGGCVIGQVIPTAFAADIEFLFERVFSRRGISRSAQQHYADADNPLYEANHFRIPDLDR